MRAVALAAVIAVAASWGASAAGDDTGMTAAANGFYGVYKTFHPSDGIPSANDRAKYAPFISPALTRLLVDADAAATRFAAANKGSPPLVEGDLFTSLFEGATSVQVQTCTGDGQTGNCLVKLEHSETGKQPTDWTDTVFLVNTAAGWRVDDIAYGGGWEFGNRGRLSETLKQVTAFQ